MAYKQYFLTFDKSGQKMCVEMAMMMENFQQKSSGPRDSVFFDLKITQNYV